MSITLKSNDNKELKVEEEACKLSKYLTNQISSGKKEIVFDEMNGQTLENVVKYLTHYQGKTTPQIPEVLTSSDLKKQLDDFDFNFINEVNFEQAFHLINAGVLLEIDHLHDLACAKIAAFMKGKTPEEVNKEFTIECQLTQEEAKELGLDGS